jgi:hypothetical protein
MPDAARKPDRLPRALARLQAQAEATVHPIDQACLQGEQALMLARLGRHAEAQVITRDLHQRFDTQPDPRVSVWLALAEGLDGYYRNLDLAGRDRLRRAHALAAAARLRPLQALAAAWLAQLDYVRHDLNGLQRHLGDALDGAQGDDHAVQARAALVMAQAWHWVHRIDRATPWYTACRQHAQADGDDATLAALMHNAAWLRAAHARHRAFWPSGVAGASELDARQAQALSDSAASLDRLIDSQALAASLPLLQALLAVDRGEWERALAGLSKPMDEPMEEAPLGGRWQALVAADRAWCEWNLGNPPAAGASAAAAVAAMDRQPDADDRALTHARLAQVFAALKDPAAADHHGRLAELDRADADQGRAAMVDLLEAIERRHRPV